MRYLLILSFLALCNLFVFAQGNPNAWHVKRNAQEWAETEVNVDDFLNKSNKDKKVSIIVIRQVPESKYDSIPSFVGGCVDNYSINLFAFKVYELTSQSIVRCKVIVDGVKKENPDLRSTCYIGTPLKSVMKYLDANLTSFSLVKKGSANPYYKLESINGEADFCWKLSQLMYNLERVEELNSIEGKKEEQSNVPVKLNLASMTDFGNSVSGDFPDNLYVRNSDAKAYGNLLFASCLVRLNNQSKWHYEDDIENSDDDDKFENAKRIYNDVYLGLTVGYSTGSSSIQPLSFVDAASRMEKVNGFSRINVYGKDILEKVDWKSERLGLEWQWNKNILSHSPINKSRFMFGIAINPFLISNARFRSSLVGGTFSYRGVHPGVSGEITNYQEEGLVENYVFAGSPASTVMMRGYGYTFKLNVAFGNDKFSLNLSPGYTCERFQNRSVMSADSYCLSNNTENYASSLNSMDSFYLKRFGVGLGINVMIN